MAEGLRTCDGCGERQAVYHLTLRVEAFGPAAAHTWRGQVHLCPRCHLQAAQVFARDAMQRQRLAARLTENSAFVEHEGVEGRQGVGGRG